MKYEKIEGAFSDFQKYLSETFGAAFGRGDDEGVYGDFLQDDPWVMCPCCGEPINAADVFSDGKIYWDCPACAFIEDEVDF